MTEWTPSLGERCKIAWVHHSALKHEVGKTVIVRRISELDGHRLAWCAPDLTFKRKRRNGSTYEEPACWQSLYLIDQLEPEFADRGVQERTAVPA